MKAIIFDLDGVVADTAALHYRSWKRLADEEGIPFSPIGYRALLGRNREDSLRLFAGDVLLGPVQSADWLARKQLYFLDELETLDPTAILPGVRDLLGDARSEGIALGLASSSRNAHAVLNKLEIHDCFDVIADGATPCPPKPAPDIFLRVAAELGSTPGEAVVIEDSEAGKTAAQRGGFMLITVGPIPISPVHRETLGGLAPMKLFELAAESRCRA